MSGAPDLSPHYRCALFPRRDHATVRQPLKTSVAASGQGGLPDVVWEAEAFVLRVREGLLDQITDVYVRQPVVHAGTLPVCNNDVSVTQRGQMSADRALRQHQHLDETVDGTRALAEDVN